MSYLFREIDITKRYDNFFKKSNCTVSFKGFGDTQKTLELMGELTYKYKNQSVLIANHLQTSSNNLKQLINNTHKFLYNTFQYAKDGLDQNLKSPNCAYTNRQIGIDCKSFSLIGGTILLVNNLKFYYRKVRQTGDAKNQYSHVFIIVPENQRTGDLSQGYYVIDGTLKYNNEVEFIQKKDLFMKSPKLPHYALNAPKLFETNFVKNFDAMLSMFQQIGVSNEQLLKLKNTVNSYLSNDLDFKIKFTNRGIWIDKTFIVLQSGLGVPYEVPDDVKPTESDTKDEDNKWFSELFSSINWDDLWNNISTGNWGCIGGTTWDKNNIQNRINVQTLFLNKQRAALSNANNLQQLETALNNLAKGVYTFYWGIRGNRDKHGWNSCSTANLNIAIAYGQTAINKFEDNVNKLKQKYHIIRTEHPNTDPYNSGLYNLISMGFGDRFGEKIHYPSFVIRNEALSNNGNDIPDKPDKPDKENSTSPLLKVAGLATLLKLTSII